MPTDQSNAAWTETDPLSNLDSSSANLALPTVPGVPGLSNPVNPNPPRAVMKLLIPSTPLNTASNSAQLLPVNLLNTAILGSVQTPKTKPKTKSVHVQTERTFGFWDIDFKKDYVPRQKYEAAIERNQDLSSKNKQLQARIRELEKKAYLSDTQKLAIARREMEKIRPKNQVDFFLKHGESKRLDFSDEDMVGAIVLKAISFPAYKYLREQKMMLLPGVSTLRTWMKDRECLPGDDQCIAIREGNEQDDPSD